MAEIPKSKSTSKQTISTKFDNVSKQKQMNDNKDQSSQQQFRKSLQLKPEGKHENLIEFEKEQQQQHEVIPQIYFGTASPFLQSVILCHILSNHLSLFEQIEMRRVCRLWHYNVKHIWAKTRALVLTLKDQFPSAPTSLKQNKEFETNVCLNHFDFPTMINKVELTIGKNHWNRPTIDLLGDLFRNIEHLTIFYELPSLNKSTENLGYFFKHLKEVTSFSLIVSMSCQNGTLVHFGEDFLSRIFFMVNKHLAPLHTLHIYLPLAKYNFKDVCKLYPALDNGHFNAILPYLQNFTLNCAVENLGEMLQSMGKSLPSRWPMQSLSINVRDKKSLSPLLSTLFEQNPKLSQIKRLELTSLDHFNLEMVFMDSLLGHFNQVECLHLCSWISCIKITTEWIQSLGRLSHLKELLLWNFDMQIFQNIFFETPLPNIRKLSVVTSYNMLWLTTVVYRFEHDGRLIRVDPRSGYTRYLHNFAKQFPKLEQLTIKYANDFASVEKFHQIFAQKCFIEFRYLKSLQILGPNGENLISPT